MWPLARVGLGFALCTAVGAAALPRPPGRFGWLAPLEWPVAAGTGMALAVPLLFALGLSGLPIATAIAPLLLALALAARIVRGHALGLPPSPRSGGRFILSSSLLLAALAVFAAKIAVVPVWCWDHYMVWGMKARTMLPDGILDLRFLRIPPFSAANADYPLGLPLAWRVLTLGQEPSAADFKACHVLFGIGVALTVRRILREAGSSAAWADIVATAVAVSPLFWDTESLGIAEMPLAFFAVTGLCLLLRPPAYQRRFGWMTGWVLGFLPWVKKEGLPLALLLFAAGYLIARKRGRPDSKRLGFAPIGLSLGAMCAGVWLSQRFLLPRGLSFFEGPWWQRANFRLFHLGPLLATLGREAAAPDWFGFWIAFVLAAALALRRREIRALGIFLVVFAQAAFYLFVYLATYLNPIEHADTSFFRILGALLPLAATGMGLLRTAPEGGSPAPGTLTSS